MPRRREAAEVTVRSDGKDWSFACSFCIRTPKPCVFVAHTYDPKYAMAARAAPDRRHDRPPGRVPSPPPGAGGASRLAVSLPQRPYGRSDDLGSYIVRACWLSLLSFADTHSSMKHVAPATSHRSLHTQLCRLFRPGSVKTNLRLHACIRVP